MKKVFWVTLIWLGLASTANAQFTQVTGTVVDPNGLPYALGTISPLLILPGNVSPTLNGTSYIAPSQASGLDKNGYFTVNLADNTQLLPAGTKWNFTVCSAAGTIQPAGGNGPVCFQLTSPITISGTSQDISAQLNAVAPALSRFGTAVTTSPPSMGVAPSILNFGTVQTNTDGPSQPVTISNTGNSAVVISSVTISGNGDFRSPNLSACTGLLPSGQGCVLLVFLHPTSAGAEPATTLTVNSNVVFDPQNPSGNTVALSGSGTASATFPLSISSGASTGPGVTTSNEATPLISCITSPPAAQSGACSDSYVTGSTPILTFTPTGTPPSTLGTVSGGGCVPSGQPATCTLAAIVAPTTVNVSYNAAVATATINVTSIGQGGGTMVSSVNDISGTPISATCTAGGVCTGKSTGVFFVGTAMNITVTASGGSTLVAVSGCGATTTSPCPLTVQTNQTITGNFAPTTVPISLPQQVANCDKSTANHVKCTWASAMTAGDAIFCQVYWADSTTTVSAISDTKGNTYTARCGPRTQTNLSDVLYSANNIAAAGAGANVTDMTASTNVASRGMMCAEYAGIVTAGSPLDAACSVAGANTGQPTANNYTTVTTGDLLTGWTVSNSTVSAKSANPWVQQITDTGLNDEEDQQGSGNGVAIGTYPFQPTLASGGVSWITFNVGWKSQGATAGTFNSLTVLCAGGGSGTVALPGATLTCTGGQGSASVQVATGSTANLTASALTGSVFGPPPLGWSGVTGCSVSPNCTVPNITTNTTLTATFSLSGQQAYFVNFSTGSDANSGLCPVAGAPVGCNGPWKNIYHADGNVQIGPSGTVVHVAPAIHTPTPATGVVCAGSTYSSVFCVNQGGTSLTARLVYQCDTPATQAMIGTTNGCYLSMTPSTAVTQMVISGAGWPNGANNVDIVGFHLAPNAKAYSMIQTLCVGGLAADVQCPNVNSWHLIGNLIEPGGADRANNVGGTFCNGNGIGASLSMAGRHGNWAADLLYSGNIIAPFGSPTCFFGYSIYMDGGHQTAYNNIAWQSSVGVHAYDAGCFTTISNNAFINMVDLGILVWNHSTFGDCTLTGKGRNSIDNNVIVNTGVGFTPLFGEGAGIQLSGSCDSSHGTLVSNNIMSGNVVGNFLGYPTQTFPGGFDSCATLSNTISEAPTSTFVNFANAVTAATDLHLKPTSLGVNGGTTQCAAGVAACTPLVDFSNTSRPQGPAIDIGVFEQ